MIPLHTLRDHLGVDTSQYDDLLLAYEAAAVAHVENATGRYFGPLEEVTELPTTGKGTSTLWLGEAPVATTEGDPPVTAVRVTVVQAYSAGDPGEVLDPDTDFGWTVRGSALVRKVGVWHPRYEYRVTYTRGYAEGEEPADIQLFVLQYVAQQWSERSHGGIASETIGGYSVTFSKIATGADESLLARWRRPVIA